MCQRWRWWRRRRRLKFMGGIHQSVCISNQWRSVLVRPMCTVILMVVVATKNIVIVAQGSSRAYPLGCSQEASSYYDYDNCPFPPPGILVKSSEDYQLVERLGTGKFGDVFSAVEVVSRDTTSTTTDVVVSDDGANDEGDCEKMASLLSPTQQRKSREYDPNSLVVIKCLKPVTDRKIRRELLILFHSSKLPNLARLLVSLFLFLFCASMAAL